VGSRIWCHVSPEGWIEGIIIKCDVPEMAYVIQLLYNSERIMCAVDSDWFVRSEEPTAEEKAYILNNKCEKPRRFGLGEEVFVRAPWGWVHGQVVAHNEPEAAYRIALPDGQEVTSPSDSPTTIRSQMPSGKEYAVDPREQKSMFEGGQGSASAAQMAAAGSAAIFLDGDLGDEIPAPCEGWLWKKGKGSSFLGRRNWKKRFFRLDNGQLTYAKEEETPPIGTLQLVEQKQGPLELGGAGRRARQDRTSSELSELSQNTLEVDLQDRLIQLRTEVGRDGDLDAWHWAFVQHLEYYSRPDLSCQ